MREHRGPEARVFALRAGRRVHRWRVRVVGGTTTVLVVWS